MFLWYTFSIDRLLVQNDQSLNGKHSVFWFPPPVENWFISLKLKRPICVLGSLLLSVRPVTLQSAVQDVSGWMAGRGMRILWNETKGLNVGEGVAFETLNNGFKYYIDCHLHLSRMAAAGMAARGFFEMRPEALMEKGGLQAKLWCQWLGWHCHLQRGGSHLWNEGHYDIVKVTLLSAVQPGLQDVIGWMGWMGFSEIKVRLQWRGAHLTRVGILYYLINPQFLTGVALAILSI